MNNSSCEILPPFPMNPNSFFIIPSHTHGPIYQFHSFPLYILPATLPDSLFTPSCYQQRSNSTHSHGNSPFSPNTPISTLLDPRPSYSLYIYTYIFYTHPFYFPKKTYHLK
ncbi:hypothetical protein VIGAN_11168100 [Vigna angularis var. angularis]|uniref:Uncharacterized protein n=1 Tax=Vigna angularis var. angularis TaxID=157739 RepID=A0A0S3TAG6_PHAAN|nr:hypothetical protein VIGAN_11168100 [Vigna angularis var. angularis]